MARSLAIKSANSAGQSSAPCDGTEMAASRTEASKRACILSYRLSGGVAQAGNAQSQIGFRGKRTLTQLGLLPYHKPVAKTPRMTFWQRLYLPEIIRGLLLTNR